jgi:hypothetical protein
MRFDVTLEYKYAGLKFLSLKYKTYINKQTL